MIYFCCKDERRDAVREHAVLNGIDFLEVFDDESLPFEMRQRTLFLHFIKELAPGDLSEANIIIEGGDRIRGIRVLSVTSALSSPPSLSPPLSPPDRSTTLRVEVSEAGDFSTYTLRLVQGPKSSQPPTGFDPVLSAIDFSFKVTCDSEFDCKESRVCETGPLKTPDIDYLAKDYASFRKLMLDRISALSPEWRERSPADTGVALVELLAYVGDYLSYQQDAVATESYLRTARRRVSLRRLARLIDYPLREGRNARAWIHLEVRDGVDGIELQRGKGSNTTKLFTRFDGPTLIRQGSKAYDAAMGARPYVFELMHDIKLYSDHNRMEFYTWGERECCLPKGATRATLRKSLPNLRPGDVLIFQEVKGPQTGEALDRDPTNRAAVRLTHVRVSSDPLGGRFEDPETDDPVSITEIEWAPRDALAFPLCISSREGTASFDNVSVAFGNVVLADHGMTFTDRPDARPFDPFRDETSLDPPVVASPDPALTRVGTQGGNRCEEQIPSLTPQRYYPRLRQRPLTRALAFDAANPPPSASEAVRPAGGDETNIALPVIQLSEPGAVGIWEPRRDLLASGPNKKEFVVEEETDGSVYLRFGDDRLGLRPAPGTTLLATYRIGNGVQGNIGRDSIAHLVSSDPAIISDLSDPLIISVTNPLPAAGGIDAETNEQIRQNAPSAMRTQERAVIPRDYAEVARRCSSDIQRAAATFRWTGSWRTVFLSVDRFGGASVDEEFESGLRRCLERYRMAGHDVEVDGPVYVSLEVEMVVCVKRTYFREDVKAALLEVFSNRLLPNGGRGIFHPDNFTFGQPVYLSSLYAAAQAVQGVDSVDITRFQRQGIDSAEAIDTGHLDLQRLEIARLDNDPDFPERGLLRLIVRGGQ